jgi:cell division septation protein DedD
VPLPDGYRVEHAEGSLRLFNPEGELLKEEPHGPDAAAAVEERAWQDVWRQLELELKEELQDLRAGVRPLHELRRVRQYMRMLDAVRGTAPVEAQQPRRREVVAWLALAASAAAIAAVLWTTPLRLAQEPEQTPQVATSGPGSTTSTVRRTSPAPETARKPVPVQQPRVRTASRPRPARVVGEAITEPAVRWAVGFGEYASHTAAEINMHLIRGKGYIVYVKRMGDSFQVVTRPYRSRAQAERLANALQEIGLPAKAQPAVPRAL